LNERVVRRTPRAHTHTHTFTAKNQTRKPKQNETQLPIADLPPLPTFCLYTFLKILI
jgi:hypothetical protein